MPGGWLHPTVCPALQGGRTGGGPERPEPKTHSLHTTWKQPVCAAACPLLCSEQPPTEHKKTTSLHLT